MGTVGQTDRIRCLLSMFAINHGPSSLVRYTMDIESKRQPTEDAYPDTNYGINVCHELGKMFRYIISNFVDELPGVIPGMDSQR